MAKPTETMKEKKPRARALNALIFRMPMAMGITVIAFSRMSTRMGMASLRRRFFLPAFFTRMQ